MKKRFPHIIRKNQKTESPQRIIFFDTETFEEKNDIDTELHLKLGVLCYQNRQKNSQNEWFTFRSVSEFWNFVMVKNVGKTKLYLVAHNVAFDFRIVKGFSEMEHKGYKIKNIIYQGTTNIYNFRNDRKKVSICVIDNMNFFKSSLKSLGKSIGLDKMEMPDVNDEENLEIYCKRDVEIMVKAWEFYFKFLKDNNLGNFAKTIAGQAFAAYRHRFMKNEIHVHTNKKAVKMERESYHGGRTECFKLGEFPKENYYLLDVNSMYPSVMRDYSYPSKLINIKNEISIKLLSDYLMNRCVTARVLIKTKDPIYPVKMNNRLIFPVGEFETVLTTRELKYALYNNHILKILEASIYEKNNLFKDYVDFFFKKKSQYKDEKNDAFTYMTKLFLNSLYGKFGQRNESFQKLELSELPSAYRNMLLMNPDGIYKIFSEKEEQTFKKINGEFFMSEGLFEGVETFVAIASHITADARMKLWNYFNIAKRENVFYCDTDSMITNEKGYKNCVPFINKKLGFLGQKEMSKNLIIRGAKDYIFGDDEVIKGIRKNAVKISDHEFQQIKFEGLAGALRKNRLNEVHIENVNKILKRNYTKGDVQDNGDVIPFSIKDSTLENLTNTKKQFDDEYD